ncbi:MAG: translocation/assembly module TamB domain-containing protein [Balneolales bacterium]
MNSYLAQDQDSIWNFEKVLPEGETEEGTEAGPFPFQVERAQIHGSNVFVNAPLILPDTSIQVREINMLAGFELYEEGFSFDLDNFEFDVHEERFSDPVRFETAASGDTTAIQLDHLMIAGGASLFEMMGDLDLESEEVEVSALLGPLSWRTIRAYAEDAPLNQDIFMRMSVEGEMDNLHAQLIATSVGMEEFSINAGLSLGSDPALTNLSMNARNVDFGVLLDDPEMPSFGELESSFEGFVSFENYESGTLDGVLRLFDIHMDPYVMDQLALNLALRDNEVFTNLELNRAGGMFFTEAHVTELWSEMPNWSADYQVNQINPAVWAADEELEGMINADGTLNGRGFEFGEDPINFQLNVRESNFQGQRLESAQVTGWVNDEIIDVDSEFHTQRNLLLLNANVVWAAEEPTYSFTINTRDFDISEFMMEDTLTTRLNLDLSGEGKNFELGKMELTAAMNMDSSLVNGEEINVLSTNIDIRDSVLVLDDFIINSQFAEGNLFVRQNLIRLDDLENDLEFDIQLLDLQPLAELAGAETLNAQGTVSGNVFPDRYERLALNVNLDVNDIAYDTLTIENIAGRITTIVDENPDFDLDLSLNQLELGEYEVEDIRLLTAGSYIDEILTGSYSFGLIIEGENGLRQRADFRYHNQSLNLTTHELDLVSEEGNYTLQGPFDVVYADELIAIDTLVLRGERTGATVQLALDQYGPESFRGNFEADYINLGLLQDIALNEVFFDGILMTQADFDIHPDQMNISSETVLADFTYNNLDLDTLQLNLDLADDRLLTDFSIQNDLQTLLASEFDLPFVLTDPEELEDEFFQEPVLGYVEVTPLDLEIFIPVLEEFGLESLVGMLALNSTLSGTAGAPDFNGEVALNEAVVSDIPIREFSLNWNYDHDSSNISLNSYLDTETQRVFDLNGDVPFYIDFQTFEFLGPQESDELAFNFRSDNFNLAVFRDFLDPETVRDLEGVLNADVAINGPMEDLTMEGFFRISDGRVRAVPNEVTFRDISVDIGLEPGKIVLERASVQSAGSLTGQGEVELDGITPENFNLDFDARNFHVYATRDIDAFIGMDAGLQGTMETPRLTGDVSVERGTIYLDEFGGSEVEEVVLEEDVENDDIAPDVEVGFYENLAMEMNFLVTRNLFLRNRSNPEMELALAGNLDLVKLEGQDMEIFGDVSIPSGYATTFGKRFEIDTGTIVFSGDPENPQMDIRTIYRPRQQERTQIEIFYTISGTLDEPEFSYESDPEMAFQDIVSYTLFGRPFNALAGFEQGAAGRAEGDFVSELAMEVLLDRVEALAAEQIGIDVLEIDNNRRGPGSGTSIKAGKFLSDRVFVAYIQELGGSDSGRQVLIEYMMRQNLDLVITGSDDHRSGVDVMWNLDY